MGQEAEPEVVTVGPDGQDLEAVALEQEANRTTGEEVEVLADPSEVLESGAGEPRDEPGAVHGADDEQPAGLNQVGDVRDARDRVEEVLENAHHGDGLERSVAVAEDVAGEDREHVLLSQALRRGAVELDPGHPEVLVVSHVDQVAETATDVEEPRPSLHESGQPLPDLPHQPHVGGLAAEALLEVVEYP